MTRTSVGLGNPASIWAGRTHLWGAVESSGQADRGGGASGGDGPIWRRSSRRCGTLTPTTSKTRKGLRSSTRGRSGRRSCVGPGSPRRIEAPEAVVVGSYRVPGRCAANWSKRRGLSRGPALARACVHGGAASSHYLGTSRPNSVFGGLTEVCTCTSRRLPFSCRTVPVTLIGTDSPSARVTSARSSTYSKRASV